MKKIILYTLLLLLLTSSNVLANDQNGITNVEQLLGISESSTPGSTGGLPLVSPRHPNQQQIGVHAGKTYTQNGTVIKQVQQPKTTSLPAWAQQNYLFPYSTNLRPFGENLFMGHFASTYSDDMNSEYIIQSGDRIVIRIWGAQTYDDVLIVDQQGNIFLPEIGPIRVAGLRQATLLTFVRSKISEIFTDNVNTYVNLQSSQPIAVYVTGFVNNPGRYAGGSRDSVLSYLDRAGGIISDRGSYRNIKIKRKTKELEQIDLYEFILQGKLPSIRLQDGDVIVVEEVGQQIITKGACQEAIYELSFIKTAGGDLMKLSSPKPNASHISLQGIRNGIPINEYYNLADFTHISLQNGDTVTFVADKKSQSIMISVAGATIGASRFPVDKTTTLKEFLPYISVDSELADTESIYILRHSVAIQQKVILQEALQRLERAALTATSKTAAEANIRVSEAELIQDYVKRAAQIEPNGLLVVYNDGKLLDTVLEDLDIVVVPQKSNVIHISGEVMLPSAILWDKSMKFSDYIEHAGGYSNRADKRNVLVLRMNGEVGKIKNMGIMPGDRILVLPKFAGKGVEFFKSITQILYQIALATKIALDI